MDINNNLAETDADIGEESTNCENSLLDEQDAASDSPVEKNDETQIDLSASIDAADPITPDKVPIVTVWCLILLIHPIVMRVYDFLNDVGLAIEYFEDHKTVYGGFTLALTTLQAITTALISCMIHHPKLGDYDKENEVKREKNCLDKIASLIARYGIIIPFLLAMPLCHLRNLYYAWKVRKYQLKGDEAGLYPYHHMMLQENRDLALLGVVVCCLQAAPQLIFQLYILLTGNQPINYLMWFKIVGGCVTLLTLGTSMKDYYCAIREAKPDRANVNDVGGVFLFLWHFGVIAARVFTIAISASNWLSYTLLACIVNWMIWTVWIYVKENGVSVILFGKKTSDSSAKDSSKIGQKIRNLFFAGVLAVVYMFTFVNLRNGRSVIRNSVYYLLYVLQNGTVLALYFILTNVTVEYAWLSKCLLILSVILVLSGITAMATYYKFFHPATVKKMNDFEIDDNYCSSCVECYSYNV